MKQINVIILAMLLSFSGAMSLHAEKQPSEPAVKQVEVIKADAATLKKKRGQLLSKRNKLRRLEKEALAKDPELKSKIDDLQLQRQALFIEANSELKGLYEEEEAMVQEIEQMSAKK